jgi:hypothetical protein
MMMYYHVKYTHVCTKKALFMSENIYAHGWSFIRRRTRNSLQHLFVFQYSSQCWEALSQSLWTVWPLEMMKLWSFVMPGTTDLTQCHIPQDLNPCQYTCGNLKSHMLVTVNIQENILQNLQMRLYGHCIGISIGTKVDSTQDFSCVTFTPNFIKICLLVKNTY